MPLTYSDLEQQVNWKWSRNAELRALTCSGAQLGFSTPHTTVPCSLLAGLAFSPFLFPAVETNATSLEPDVLALFHSAWHEKSRKAIWLSRMTDARMV